MSDESEGSPSPGFLDKELIEDILFAREISAPLGDEG